MTDIEHGRFMQRALELAHKAAELGEVPVGAVIVSSNDVILGEGFNQPISSCDPTAHAEVVALRDAAKQQQNYRLPGSRIYITIEPCSMCLGALVHARVNQIIYGATEPKAGMLDSHSALINAGVFNHQLDWIGGVEEASCRAVMQDFFKARRAFQKAQRQTSSEP